MDGRNAMTSLDEAIRALEKRWRNGGLSQAGIARNECAEDLAALLTTRQEVAPVADGAALLVRDVCEMAPADPDAPDTVCIRVADLTRIAELYTPTGQTSDARDAQRLDWLRANEFDLVTRREDMGDDEYAIWWFVIDSRKTTKRHLHSVSGHPVGSPREAIDAAMRQEAGDD